MNDTASSTDDTMETPRLTVYTTPTCPYCTKLKQWLDQEDIAYEEHDVASDREKAEEMVQITGQRGVPQTVVDGETAIVGFRPEQIQEAL